MKLVNVTLVLSPGADGAAAETRVSDPGFALGGSYAIPEIGGGLWTVTDVGEPTTSLVGGKMASTTRVTVVAAAPGTAATPSTAPAARAGGRPSAANAGRPVPRPTQKTRHTPK